MKIWAFDLATNTGFAMGEPPPDGDLSRLQSGTFHLRAGRPVAKEADEDMAQTCLAFRSSFRHRMAFKEDHPDLVVFEAPIDINATFKNKDTGEEQARSAASKLLPGLLVNTLRLECLDWGIKVEKVWPATIRTSFIDKKSAGERSTTKTAVLDRCKLWGYLPEKCKDDNRADAVSIWHWAQLKFGRWDPPFEIVMGQKVQKVRPQLAL